MHAGEEGHARPGWTQDVDRTPRGRVSQHDGGQEINGESTSMVWPTRGPRTAKEQNKHSLEVR